uniref:ATP-dependent RNA helicase n=1 Tax=Dermatophagoides pteronyssinus TaxID=6956 RepID=A0A6P6Y185_DERPT
DDLPMHPQVLRSLQKFARMSLVQLKTLPYALNGFDVCCEAPTGSGKTLCFVLPILESMLDAQWTRDAGTFALLLAPTRELTTQIFNVFRDFNTLDVSLMAVYGGKFFRKEAAFLKGMGIVVGTPGRVIAHLEKSYNLDVSRLKYLVLDEADKLIEVGFQSTIMDIVSHLPPKEDRVNLMFSATLRGSVSALIKQLCRDDCIKSVYCLPSASEQLAVNSSVRHAFVVIPLEHKLNYLLQLLQKHSQQKCLIFCSTVKQVRYLFEIVTRLRTGAKIYELQGSMSQAKRITIYSEFMNKTKSALLITTDLIGRGIDFTAVDLVIQLDCPENEKTYTHRAGRTARGLNYSGDNVLLLLPSETQFTAKLARHGCV